MEGIVENMYRKVMYGTYVFIIINSIWFKMDRRLLIKSVIQDKGKGKKMCYLLWTDFVIYSLLDIDG